MCYGYDMSLILGGVKYDKIKMLGRWMSEDMNTYIHTSENPPLQYFSDLMANHSEYKHITTPT